MTKNVSSEQNRVDETVFALLESLPDAVYLIDLKGVILNTNTQFALQFGKQPQECIGTNIYDLIINVLQLPELASYHKEKCKEVLRTGKRVSFADDRDIRKVTISPFRFGEGKITSFLIAVQNVAEQKRLELELKRQQPRFDFALEAAHAGVWEWDLETNILIWSNQIWSLQGLERSNEKPTFQLWTSSIYPDDRELTLQSVFQAVTNTEEMNIEFRVCHPDNSIHWLLSRGKPLFDGEGHATNFFGTVIDITERKQIELELRESKERYSYALDASGCGIWEWDQNTDTLSWSEQVWGLYGLKVNSVPLTNQLCVDTIHPDDREMVSWIIRNAVSKGTAASLEYRTTHPDGSVHWLTSRGMPLLDDDGKVTRYIGAIIDITERKQIEAELLNNKERLTFALEATSTGVWEWDVIEDKVTWTDNVWKLYGLEKNSLPHTHRLFESNIHPDDREMAIKAVSTAADNQTGLYVEYRIFYSNGSVRWLMSRGKPLFDKYGKAERYIGTIIDITERKAIEEQLGRSQERLDFVLESSHIGIWDLNLEDGSTARTIEHARIFGYETIPIKTSHGSGYSFATPITIV